jgi:acetyl-CoA carboxylase carboxyl transferase subunit alpha
LKALGLIDKIVGEPLGGAHRDHDATMQTVKKALQDSWRQLKDIPLDKVLETRFGKLIGYGKFKEVEQK